MAAIAQRVQVLRLAGVWKSFDGVDANDRQKILWANAAKLYKIPSP